MQLQSPRRRGNSSWLEAGRRFELLRKITELRDAGLIDEEQCHSIRQRILTGQPVLSDLPELVPRLEPD